MLLQELDGTPVELAPGTKVWFQVGGKARTGLVYATDRAMDAIYVRATDWRPPVRVVCSPAMIVAVEAYGLKIDVWPRTAST